MTQNNKLSSIESSSPRVLASSPLLLVGLGNPGPKYDLNRHNVGFMALDVLMRRHVFSAEQKKFQGLIAEGQWGNEKTLALKPMTYMNLSGQSVGDVCRFYKIPPEQVIVLHDELALPLGDMRLKKGGSHAGHNGLKSLDAHIGQDYLRLRIGIGHPGAPELVTDYVLGNFSKTEMKIVEPMLDDISDKLAENLKRFTAQGSNQVKFLVS